MATKKKKNVKLVPNLRFPEFVKDGAWSEVPLNDYTKRITTKVGSKVLPPVSITAGKGFVEQSKKFGRDISGDQYKSYIHIKKGDFVYNKGNSKTFAQGCVYQLNEFDEAAASSAFICFKLEAQHVDLYFQNIFEHNVHGRKLAKFITSGARSNGLLNINATDFFSIELPIPPERIEQQKIADCLSSLDKLIAAHSTKLAALQDHKKALLQKLFPAKGETTPELRFSEFTEGGGWKQSTIGQTFKTQSGGTPSRNKQSYWNGDIPWVTTSLVNFNVITKVIEYISADGLENSSAKIFPQSTILLAMYGQGKTRGQVAILGIEAATNQACAAILPSSKVGYQFTFQNLSGRYEELRKLSNEGGQQNLSQTLVKDLSFSYPTGDEEQQKLANCLSSLDSLITAQIDKTAYLKEHKKGLMQQLFPNSEEVVT